MKKKEIRFKWELLRDKTESACMLIILPLENFEWVIEMEYNSIWKEEKQSGGGGDDECKKNQMEWYHA